MPDEALEHSIKTVVCDVFDVEDQSDIRDTTVASDVEGWDSLGHVRLLLALERKFGFRWKENEVKALENVGDLYQRVAAKLKAA